MIYEFNKWLFSRPEVVLPYNTHYSLNIGDDGHWADWDSSPVFPWSEQPESANFYILYQTKEMGRDKHFWSTKVYIDYFIYGNNVKLIGDTFSAMRKIAGRNEYAVQDFGNWMNDNGLQIDGYTPQDMYFDRATDTMSQEQENGVYGKAVRFCLLLHDC